MLAGCGGADDSRNENPMQEERSRPNLGSEMEAKGANPNTEGRLAGEGDPAITDSRIGGNEMLPSQSIVENLTSAPDLTSFASALRNAEMVRALNGTGPYTVFAPNNQSFEDLPNGTVKDLMEDKNKQHLVDLLNNHIVAGKLKSENLQEGSMLKTIGGKQLKVTKRGEEIMINGAKVTLANKESGNGVIHVINKVLVPEEQ
ncbi:hypothetical protein GCM10027293_26220 [Pontibacter aydingkolensis]